MEIREVERGRLWVNAGFEGALAQAGLLSFEGLYGAKGLAATRERPDKPRTVVRLEVGEGAERRGLYLKRHEAEGVWSRVGGWIAGRRGTSAREEWENIFRLEGLGIGTMTPVALGEDRATGRSFTVTEALEEGQPLDEFAKGAGVAKRRRLAGKLGEMVRRLHGAGLTHKDLYLCHVYAVRGKGGETELRLIDLQRVGLRRRRLRRWRVKDIAELEYSRPSEVTRTDCMRFARAYFGVGRLGPEEKRFVRSVMRKVEPIRRHDLKVRGRG